MERFLGRYAAHVYAVMRIVVGVLFACHGAQKLFGVLGLAVLYCFVFLYIASRGAGIWSVDHALGRADRSEPRPTLSAGRQRA